MIGVPSILPAFRALVAGIGVIVAFIVSTATVSHAQGPGLKPRPGVRADVTPAELEGAEIIEKLGNQVPLDAKFRDETGAPIELGSLFDGGRPVLLTFFYSSCPMLCSVQLGDLVDVLNKSPWIVGDKFRIVSISMDKSETHKQAFTTKETYLDRYTPPSVRPENRFSQVQRSVADGKLVARWKKSDHSNEAKANGSVAVDGRTAIAEGWTFLTGDESEIRKVADAVGFQFNYIEAKKEFAHPTAIMVLSPSGKMVSYLHGLSYKSDDLTSRVLSAALGEPTESTAQFLLSCFHFVKPSGFALIASKAMRWGGFLFLLLSVAIMVTVHLRKRRRQSTSDSASSRSAV